MKKAHGGISESGYEPVGTARLPANRWGQLVVLSADLRDVIVSPPGLPASMMQLADHIDAGVRQAGNRPHRRALAEHGEDLRTPCLGVKHNSSF